MTTRGNVEKRGHHPIFSTNLCHRGYHREGARAKRHAGGYEGELEAAGRNDADMGSASSIREGQQDIDGREL